MRGHIRQRGKNSWQLKVEGERDEITGKRIIHFATFRGGKRDAQNKLAELINAVNADTYVTPKKLTVGEHVEARINHWQTMGDISAKTAERYRELLANQIAPHIGDKVLQKLRPADIELWHAALKTSGRKDGKGGVSNRTSGHAHRVLAKALKDARRHELLTRNPTADASPPKVEHNEIPILGDDQVKIAVERLRGRAIYPKAITLLFMGLRRSELLALNWGNIDLAAKMIQVRQAVEETKAGVSLKVPKTKNSTRDVTMPDIVVEALREHRKAQLELRLALGAGKLTDDTLVFSKLDGSLASPRAFSKEWTDVARSIGLPGIGVHALRHTHVSMLVAAGIDVVEISKRVGHASPAITLKIYAHLFAKRDASKLAGAINTAVNALVT
jgi:integrase